MMKIIKMMKKVKIAKKLILKTAQPELWTRGGGCAWAQPFLSGWPAGQPDHLVCLFPLPPSALCGR